MKAFKNGRLRLVTKNLETGERGSVTLSQLKEAAEAEQMLQVKDALAPLLEQDVLEVQVAETYLVA